MGGFLGHGAGFSLLENRDFTALNVFVALCYYKLDYYDVSLEILAAYLQARNWRAIRRNPLQFCCAIL